MNDDVYHLVKNTPKVTGFLGSSGKPQPISEAEAARILNTKEEAAAAAPKTKVSVDYEIGDNVKVLEGPFASFNGMVEELDFDRGRVKVGVSIFGRATPVELEFAQVELVKSRFDQRVSLRKPGSWRLTNGPPIAPGTRDGRTPPAFSPS